MNLFQLFKMLLSSSTPSDSVVSHTKTIPLDRLNKLPDNIVDNIEPVFFGNRNWEKEGNVIRYFSNNTKDVNRLELTQAEELVLKLFEKRKPLRQVAGQLESQFALPYDEARQITTLLFFRLASCRICHPSKVYDIDKMCV